MYLEKFILPNKEQEESLTMAKIEDNGEYIDNVYPCSLFTQKELTEVDFEKITIFYGGNGSGKSTLLNIIASKLQLRRISPFNNSELFEYYLNCCKYRSGYDDEGFEEGIPHRSRIITSDDIFDYMLAVRTANSEVAQNIEEGKGQWAALKYGETIRLKGLENYEEFRLQVLARKKSLTRRKFLQKLAGEEVKLNSNGETAIDYFNEKIANDTLYCLDEPENSLSPKMQLQLKEMLENKARYCDCQFIIATHSPFILALNGAKIYNLDNTPVSLNKWYELENAKLFYDFFNKYKDFFE